MALSDADTNSLIIVGAGGCGMMAALVAASKGVSVLLLEKTEKSGGSTAFSSRGIRAAGSRFQRALDIEDSPEQYARDNLPKLDKYPDGMTLPSPKDIDFNPGDLLGCVSGE